MAKISYSASYTNCLHNFIIDGLPEGKTDDMLLHSFTCVLKNILTRNSHASPSSFLRSKLGTLSDTTTPIAFLKQNAPLPKWEHTIKGTSTGYNPARDFFYSDEIWDKYLPDYKWIRYLLIPEAPLTEILDPDDHRWKNQAVDFYLPAANLIIEIDGEQHLDLSQVLKDEERDEELESIDILTVRIPVKDFREQNAAFRNQMSVIHDALEDSEEIQIIRNQEYTSEAKRRLVYENVLRYQFLILELIDRGYLDFVQETWTFNVAEQGQRFVILACQDLFLWYKNLYQLKGISLKIPDIQFSNETGYLSLKNFLFSRPDERKVYSPTVLTSPWDGKDYYSVSCAGPIDYEIPWPVSDSSERGSALKFFLKEIFGFDSFKDGQWQILANLLCLKRTVGILPTGGGKSLCYQLAAMLQPGITIVVCPINSLQIDQKRNLDLAGVVHSDYIASMQDAEEKAGILKNLEEGKYQFIWISPERFQSRSFRDSVSKLSHNRTISYNVIDEVHCLSEWGHDFRTSYLTLVSTLQKTCPDTPIIGLTATASQAVLDDLKIEFDIDGTSVRSLPSLERKNLTFRVYRTSEKDIALYSILRQHHYGEVGTEPESGLVFTLTRDQSDAHKPFAKNHLKKDLQEEFPQNEDQIDLYHSDIPDKIDIQNRFLDGSLSLLSTTKAFGMGVNKRDMRFTVHYNLPWSTEAFYQEAGRAGRDDLPADCSILYSPDQFGEPNAINQVFNQYTSPETIKDLVDGKDLQGDLSTIFYLWGGNNKGVATDVDMIRKLLDRINSVPPQDDHGDKFFTIASDWTNKADEKLAHPQNLTKDRLELALYRLKLLGVVEDWMIDWSGKTVRFEVYLDKNRSKKHVRNSLIAYLKKHRETEENLKLPEPSSNSNLVEVILFYAKILVEWTYDHIAYSRRQATNNIREFCENYKGSASFRKAIDNFLRISEQSITLDGILENQQAYVLWFRAFYNSEVSDDWIRTDRFLDAEKILQLRLSAARYRESYRDVTGLNFVYVLSGIFSDYADLDIESDLLIDSFDQINLRPPEEREDIWLRIRILVEHYRTSLSDRMKEGLGYCLVKGFPDKSREIYGLLEDSHSLAQIILEATMKIQAAAAEIRR